MHDVIQLSVIIFATLCGSLTPIIVAADRNEKRRLNRRISDLEAELAGVYMILRRLGIPVDTLTNERGSHV